MIVTILQSNVLNSSPTFAHLQGILCSGRGWRLSSRTYVVKNVSKSFGIYVLVSPPKFKKVYAGETLITFLSRISP